MLMNIENRLKQIIVNCGEDVDINGINEDTDLVEVFRYSSINIIQLVVEIENEFNIEIDDENLSIEKLAKYKTILEIVESNIQQG